MDFLIEDISSVIRLAIAPVFLLAAIAQTLNVLSTRLGRIIDRGRVLNRLMLNKGEGGKEATVTEQALWDQEQYILSRRGRLIHRAIALSTLSALFVSLVIIFLFVASLAELQLGPGIAFLFMMALLCLITAFVTFLREIGLGMTTFRFGEYTIRDKGRWWKRGHVGPPSPPDAAPPSDTPPPSEP